MRTTRVTLAFLLLAGCANSPIAVPDNYFRTIRPVDIPRSYLKTMRVYVHPSYARAFVAPTKKDMSAEWYTMGLANWSARASEMIPAYQGVLQKVLSDRGRTCTASSPVAFADTLAFEFTLACN